MNLSTKKDEISIVDRTDRFGTEKYSKQLYHHKLVHNTTLNYALHCVAFASTLVETQHDTRIDLDRILALPCIAFLRLVINKSPTSLVINLCVSRINATQGLAFIS